MAKPFNIQDYLSKNSWKTGEVKKEVGTTTYKGGHNDIRKTNYDVNIVDGKLDLYTHKEVLVETNQVSEYGTVRIDPMTISNDNDLIKLLIKMAKKSKPFLKKAYKELEKLGAGAAGAMRENEEIPTISEGVGNTREIAEIFARFLIGDRNDAIRQLKGQTKNSFGTMEKGGSAEWNNQFRDLIKKLEQAIKSAL